MLNPNQTKYLLVTGFLLGGWVVISAFLLLFFGFWIVLAFGTGGVAYLIAAVLPAMYYFSFRGAHQTNQMLKALKLGTLAKFVTLILLVAGFSFLLPEPKLILLMILSVFIMNFIYVVGIALTKLN